MTTLVVIICPDVKSYKEPPEEQPGCILAFCSHCLEEMWLSKKKREKIKHHKDDKDSELFIACYSCMAKFALENPDLMRGADVRTI
jgi:hypothetical protein